jgi:hypothetical protein
MASAGHVAPGGGAVTRAPSLTMAASGAQVASGLNLLAGLWLIVAPWVLDFRNARNADWNEVTIGMAIAVLALIRFIGPDLPRIGVLTAVLGAWMIISPFLINLHQHAATAIYWNDVVVGVIVLLLGAYSASSRARAGEVEGRGAAM